MALKSVIDWLVSPGPAVARPGGDGSGPSGRWVISILVCNFDGPEGREASQRIADFLKNEARVRVQYMARKLKLSGKGSLVEQLVAAAETGHKWLIGSACDVLLWGETVGPEKNIRLRFLCATADAERQAGSFGLGDTLELAADYNVEREKLVFAAAVAAVAPRKPDPDRQQLAIILQHVTERLSPFIEAPPNEIEKKQFVSFMTCLGTIFAALWRLGGDGSRLDRAIKAYRVVLAQNQDQDSDQDDPLGFALTQNHMAAALQALSRRDNKPEPLKLAADCYRGVAASLGPDSHPNDWALAHIHLGDVLVKLSDFEDQEKYLKGAIVAYQRALKIFTRQAMPGAWAELMNQLGVTLMSLSGAMAENRPLDQAASCFRQALEVRRRNVAPLLWAQTANNLGAATFSIYKSSNNSVLLGEAAVCFEGAAEVYAQHGRNETAAVAGKNLDRVRAMQRQ